MHGIIRTRNLKEGTNPNYNNIRRIEVRYSDGRVMSFVAEAGREFFSEADGMKLTEVLETTSAIAEWRYLSDGNAT